MEGRGFFVVKADIKEAYRMVLIHPEDNIYIESLVVLIECMFPFNLKSAPKIFTMLADVMQ